MKVNLNCCKPVSPMFMGDKKVKTEAQAPAATVATAPTAPKSAATATIAPQPTADTVVISAKQPEAKKCEGDACKK